MTRSHQPGQSLFRSILPKDADWQPLPALTFLFDGCVGV